MTVATTAPIQPLQSLQQTLTQLEASVLECLDKPRQRAVHKVRTSTRRAEAQLTLLSLAPGFPPIDKESERLRKLLKKLRRAAGNVRDLDVQQELIAQALKQQLSRSTTSSPAAARTLQHESDKLSSKLEQRRDKQSGELLHLLHKLHKKLPEAIHYLNQALEEANPKPLDETQLVRLVHNWYTRHSDPHRGAATGDPDELHAIRKVAKLARYLAETAPEEARRARKLATHFESLQKAGGEWHDWLLLAEVAEDELGDEAALLQFFRARARQSLQRFRRDLGVETAPG